MGSPKKWEDVALCGLGSDWDAVLHTCPFCRHDGTLSPEFVRTQDVRPYGRHFLAVTCNNCGNGAAIYKPAHLSSWRGASCFPEFPAVEAPIETPENVAKFFVQAARNLAARQYDAAGAMARKALEASVKGMGAEGGTIWARIEDLKQKNLVVGPLAEWAHALREGGADAVHEDEPVSAELANDLVTFARYYLECVYSISKRVGDLRADYAERKAQKKKNGGT
jgi:HEPN domain-containing protein